MILTVTVFVGITLVCVKTIALRIAECNFKKQRHRKQHSVKPCWELAIVRGRSNAVWQLYFLKIATRSAFRSTLLPVERLETASERRMSDIAHQGNSRTRGVSRWCVRVPSSLVLSVAQKVHDRMNYQ